MTKLSISEQSLTLAAEALIQYETSGTCELSKPCGLCDCGMDALTPEALAERIARDIDRAKYIVDAALNEELVAKVLHYISSSTPWDELNPGQKTAARSDARVFRGAILGNKFLEIKITNPSPPATRLGDEAAQTLARYGATPRPRKRDRS